jgi:poly-gamma-glutamate capsule biosynthesis protein CapA/YwtB (metallophosphatase superfamily)
VIVGAGVFGGFTAGQSLFGPHPVSTSQAQPTPTTVAEASPPPGTHSLGPTGSVGPTRLAPPTPAPTPTTTPPQLVRATVPLVPVVGFWSRASSISRDEIISAVESTSRTYERVVVPTGASAAIAQSLGLTLGTSVTEAEPEPLRAAVADGALGLLPLPEVSPMVRALAVDGISLFGNSRAPSLDTWPINVTLDLPPVTWDQANTWSLVAGGDILLDRGVANQVTILDKGVEFPWDGGTVSITGHHCCTPFGWPVPETKRTGHAGAVRALFGDADLALANLEGPVLDNFRFHEHGFTFTGDPRLLKGVANAGLDFVSLANNHIGNGGVRGLRDTIDALDALGIAHAGAGADLVAASQPALLSAGGQRVAIVSCSQVGGFVAGEDKAGLQRCSSPTTVAQISAARAAGDVVIVFPHWGVEYRAKPTHSQLSLAAAFATAGADVILGSHPHWAEAIDDIYGTFVFYCLGNLVFDQTWSEATMEGLIVELTFQGHRLVQAWIHPTLIHSAAQPNLLDYNGGGSVVLQRVRDASKNIDF